MKNATYYKEMIHNEKDKGSDIFCACLFLCGGYFRHKLLLKFIELMIRCDVTNIRLSQRDKDMPLQIEATLYPLEEYAVKMTYITMPIIN